MTTKAHDKTESKQATQSAPDSPPKLATLTDLSLEQTKAISEAVNPLIADAFALYTKYKNFHWHLSGPEFRSYHLMFDDHAEEVLGSIDILAERMRRIGRTTIRSIGHISKLQTIQDDNDDYVPTPKMIRRLMEDNQQMAKSQRAAIEVCENNEDSVTSNALQEILDQTEKRKWFLFEILQDDKTK